MKSCKILYIYTLTVARRPYPFIAKDSSLAEALSLLIISLKVRTKN